MERFAGSVSEAAAMRRFGCVDQYEENSVNDCEERIKGGAVKDERSPLKDAMDWRMCERLLTAGA
jgi:hypothetical protein